MYIFKITHKNTTYNFNHHLIDSQVYYESPITGELIHIPSPILREKVHTILLRHIRECL